jgi:hypothetical protein
VAYLTKSEERIGSVVAERFGYDGVKLMMIN